MPMSLYAYGTVARIIKNDQTAEGIKVDDTDRRCGLPAAPSKYAGRRLHRDELRPDGRGRQACRTAKACTLPWKDGRMIPTQKEYSKKSGNSEVRNDDGYSISEAACLREHRAHYCPGHPWHSAADTEVTKLGVEERRRCVPVGCAYNNYLYFNCDMVRHGGRRPLRQASRVIRQRSLPTRATAILPPSVRQRSSCRQQGRR